jgi:hypothetical protein
MAIDGDTLRPRIIIEPVRADRQYWRSFADLM